jgi:hypothetical protein
VADVSVWIPADRDSVHKLVLIEVRCGILLCHAVEILVSTDPSLQTRARIAAGCWACVHHHRIGQPDREQVSW